MITHDESHWTKHTCQSLISRQALTETNNGLKRVRVLQVVCPCLSKVSQKTFVHRMRVIAMGLGHSPAGSRMKQTNNSTDQYNPGCGLSQRVYRPAGRPHVHVCLHLPSFTEDLQPHVTQKDKVNCTTEEINYCRCASHKSPRTFKSGVHLLAALDTSRLHQFDSNFLHATGPHRFIGVTNTSVFCPVSLYLSR